MTAATLLLRRQAAARGVIAGFVFAGGLLLAISTAMIDVEPVGVAALASVAAGIGLSWFRPELGLLAVLAIFSDALYFGTTGVPLPLGQLQVPDLLFLGLWILTLAASLRESGGLLEESSAAIRWIAVVHPIVIALYMAYTTMAFGTGLQEILRGARSYFYLTLAVPVLFWLRRPGVLDRLVGRALLVSLAAILIQLVVYAGGIDVEPFGLFYEWQVWRGSFAGFDRSSQPFLGLNLMLLGGLICLSMRSGSARVRRGAALAMAAIGLSALITFGRGYWGALVLAAGVAVLAEAGSRAGRAAGWSTRATAALAVAGVAIVSVAPVGGFLDAVVQRGVVGAESIRYLEGTLGDRYDSVNMAIIREHWLFGIGFFLGLGSSMESDLADTGHSLYADLILRLGLAGLLLFAVLFALFVRRCRQLLRAELSGPRRAVVVGCLAASCGNLIWAVSSSHMIQRRGMLEMAFMVALVEAVGWLSSRPGERQEA